jgi:hypothetical protein
MLKPIFSLALFSSLALATLPAGAQAKWERIRLTDQFWAEGANFGDFNKDGHNDVVSGPFWYAGPDFKQKYSYYPATQSFKRKDGGGAEKTIPGFEGALGVNNAYSENFFAFTHDFNRDGNVDILIYGFPGKEAAWYENPGSKKVEQNSDWKRHQVLDVVDNESPAFIDIDGDKKPDILCMSGGYVGYATADWKSPEQKWTFHRVSEKGPWQRFTHGLGYGDVNGDGKTDILDKDGWWEQPAKKSDGPWKRHQAKFGNGGAQMYVYDFNKDGLNDVLTAIEAHGYGVAWFEQMQRPDGSRIFREHLIVGKTAAETKHGVVFSQPHAIDLFDMDGDGVKDVITGKRFWAHGPKGDAEPNAPAVLYWFKTVRSGSGFVEFVPHKIDDDSGIGTQVVAGFVNKDKLPDVVVGNKKGAFVHLQKR